MKLIFTWFLMNKDLIEKINRLREERTDQRLTNRSMMVDVWQNITLISRKAIVFTFIELTLRPGIAIKKVIAGFRRFLYGSFEYLLFTGTFIVIFNSRYHFYQNSYSNIAHSFTILDFNRKFIISFFIFAEKYPELVNLIAIPIFAFACRIFWSGPKYNFAEMFVINTYIAAQQMAFLFLLIPLIYFFPSLQFSYIMPAYFFISLIYNIWVYIQIFDGDVYLKTFKSLMVIVLGYIVQLPINMLLYHLLKPFTGLYDLIK